MIGRDIKNSLSAKGQAKRREQAMVKVRVGKQIYDADFIRYINGDMFIVACKPIEKKKMLGLKLKRRKQQKNENESD